MLVTDLFQVEQYCLSIGTFHSDISPLLLLQMEDESLLLALPTELLHLVLSQAGSMNVLRITCKSLLNEVSLLITKAKLTPENTTSQLATVLQRCDVVLRLDRVLSRLPIIHLPHLQHLVLTNSLLYLNVTGTVQAIGELQHLQRLDIGRNGFDMESLTIVLRAVAQLPCLQVLNVGFQKERFQAYWEPDVTDLFSNTMRGLDISRFPLTEQLTDNLPVCLEYLVMKEAMNYGYGHLPQTLVYLDLSDMDGPKSMPDTVAVLKLLTGLKHLNLRDYGSDDPGQLGEGLQSVALALPTTLEYLDLSGTLLTMEVMDEFCGVLAKLTLVRYLDLSDNNMGKAGLTALQPVLASLNSLRELVMIHIGMKEEDVCVQLADLLSNHSTLQRLVVLDTEGLYVESNFVDDEAAEHDDM